MENKPSISETLYAQAIGEEILKYVKDYNPQAIAREADSEAVRLLEEIQAILEDDSLDDPECFSRVDAIVRAFHRRHIQTGRHDW